MANIIDVLRKYIRPYYYFIISTIIFILFLVIGVYWYNQKKDQNFNRFKDVANLDRRNHEAPIYFFHANWCPHCKKAEPEWDAFVKQHNNTQVNGYVIKCIDVDCTSDPPPSDVKSLMERYTISSFPTVKLIRDEKTIDFDSKITRTSLGTFVNTMLN